MFDLLQDMQSSIYVESIAWKVFLTSWITVLHWGMLNIGFASNGTLVVKDVWEKLRKIELWFTRDVVGQYKNKWLFRERRCVIWIRENRWRKSIEFQGIGEMSPETRKYILLLQSRLTSMKKVCYRILKSFSLSFSFISFNLCTVLIKILTGAVIYNSLY